MTAEANTKSPAARRRDKHLRLLKVEIAAARRLARKLKNILSGPGLASNPASIEYLVALMLFVSASRTLTSILALARLQKADDAFALARVMTEKVINAEYILLLGVEAANDYVAFHQLREWRDYQELKEISRAFVPRYSAKTLESFRELMIKLN